ncbi:MAG: sodium:solute symporter family transporter [Sutterella wadsworthensis]
MPGNSASAGWAFAAPQIIAGFLILGVAGKKMAVVSRAAGALTVIDMIRARYGDGRGGRTLAALLAVLMLVFFTTMMIGQFIGGAQIFSKAAGVSYGWGLVLFGAVTVLYTAFGGFRAVAVTDTACAVLMLVGMGALGWNILETGGGLAQVMANVAAAAPRGAGSEGVLLSPTSGGALATSLLLSAWVLVGFGTLGLPQSAVRCMSYRRSSDLHQAMIVSTVVCGALMIGMTVMGVFARGMLDVPLSEMGGTTDAVMPYLIANYMDPVTAGVTLIGPLAATMSTVSSLLLAAASAIMKDLVLFHRPEAGRNEARLRMTTRLMTGALGLLALILALEPLDVIAWINLFAFGGLELALPDAADRRSFLARRNGRRCTCFRCGQHRLLSRRHDLQDSDGRRACHRTLHGRGGRALRCWLKADARISREGDRPLLPEAMTGGRALPQ